MRCDSCHHPNREQARFCEECGAALARRCGRCGESLRATARFCDGCGQAVESAPPAREPRSYTPKHLVEKVLRSRSALEGERKQVTVLFADVKGSLDLAERAGAEDWHRIIDGFLGILAEGVHRFEGTVNQYTGDGIMALFGAPVAHEDHAMRAAYAALHLRDRLRDYADGLRLSHGLSLSTRMGLHSGEVVVGKIGDDLRMDYTAKGHTVGLAARMEQLAEPGRVYVTGATAALLAGYFDFREIGPVEIRGAAQPVRVFELAAVGKLRTRLDVSRVRGFSRFVGRASEMQVLAEALARSESGDGQVVGVVGEAGVGKSRFCHEFAEGQRARGITVRVAQGLAHARSVPLLAVLGLLRDYFGFVGDELGEIARERIAGRVLRLAPEMAPSLPLLYEYLSVGDPHQPAPQRDPEERQRELWRVVGGLLRERSRREVLVQIFDDLHWFDPASLEFVDRYAESLRGTRTLLIVNFRPPFAAAWMERPGYRGIVLEPLGAAACDEMLAELLGTDPALGDLPRRIAERAAGNPFFLEELVQSLVESGSLEGQRGAYHPVHAIDRVSIPPTVEGLIAGRIDRLEEREKDVLQRAAVIGRKFGEAILQAVAECSAEDLREALSLLLEGGMIEVRSLHPEAEYAFRHPLLHEVAYRSQLGDRRRAGHAAIARALEEGAAERLDERAGLIAHHRESSGDMLPAAEWHARAARWCQLSHPATAYEHWRKAAALAGDAPGAEPLLLRCLGRTLSIGVRLGLVRDELDELLERGTALCQQCPVGPRAEFRCDAGSAQLMTGRPRSALETFEQAEHDALESGDAVTLNELRGQMVVAMSMVGRIEEAVSRGVAMLAALERSASPAELAVGMPRLAMATSDALFMSGRLGEARVLAVRAIEVSQAGRNDLTLGVSLAALARVEIVSGNLDAAIARAGEALEQSVRTGNVVTAAIARTVLGWALITAERHAEAREMLEAALELARSHGTALFVEALLLANLSRAYGGTGDPERALVVAEEAVAVGRQRETTIFEVFGYFALAAARRQTGGGAAAAEVGRILDESDDLIRKTGSRFQEPFLARERAELARLRGDEAGARAAFDEARRLWADMGAERHARRMEGLISETLRS